MDISCQQVLGCEHHAAYRGGAQRGSSRCRVADLVRQLFEHTPPDDSEMMYVKETVFGAKGGKPNNLWVNILRAADCFFGVSDGKPIMALVL